VKRPDRYRFAALLGVLIVGHFVLRGRTGGERAAPDLLLLALQMYAIGGTPGNGAAAGFVVGLFRDALSPASFGAGALAHTLVGYLTGWGKTVFFAEHVIVNGALVFAGTWIRNAVLTLASGTLSGERLYRELVIWSPLQGLSTAAVAVAILLLFRGWPAVRSRVT
jgi:rod shape-determining protein MreD